MLKKLTALFLSLLLCLSLLPSQAGAMDDSRDEQPSQAEDMGNPGSPENGDESADPNRATAWDEGSAGGGGNNPMAPYIPLDTIGGGERHDP